jgi:hypothetical protein
MEPSTTNSAPHERTIGPILWTLIIVVLLIILSLYFWGKKLNSDERARVETKHKEAEMTAQDLVGIENELKATNVEKLDATVRTTNSTTKK